MTGEILFVPSGCPHYVENLTQSIAISANYVDPSNLPLVLKELAINGLRDPRAQQLHEELVKKHKDLIHIEGDQGPKDQIGRNSGEVQVHEELRGEHKELIDNDEDQDQCLHGDETDKDATSSRTKTVKLVRGGDQGHFVSSTDCKDVEVVDIHSKHRCKNAEIVGQRNYVENWNPHVEKWIEEVERKGDLRWPDFKNNGTQHTSNEVV